MTSPVDTTVKHFHSEQASSPVLSGTAGSLIAVLDACLVNGFGTLTVTSLVVSSGIATVTVAGSHGALLHGVVEVAGASPSALDGEQKVTAIGANTISFATALANQTATGSISVKIASAGWTKEFTSTNVAVYRAPVTDGTGCRPYLQVDDTAANYAIVRGFMSMSSATVGVEAFPTTTQRPNGLFWSKANNTTGSRKWMVFADHRMFMVGVESNSTISGGYGLTGFGDILSHREFDAYGAMISGPSSDDTSWSNSDSHLFRTNTTSSGVMYGPRAVTGVGTATQLAKSFPLLLSNATSYTSGIVAGVDYPNMADGGLYISEVLLCELTATLRGKLPGVFPVPMNVPPGVFSAKQLISGVTGYTGKTFMVHTNAAGSAPYSCPTLIDITGPWR